MDALTVTQVEWTRERVELVKTTVCPQGITDGEFALFLEQCKRSGLDPLLKEAFCVPRRMNAGNRERPNWVTKHEFQPSETGMLARAERFPDFRGVQASAVYAGDDCAVDAGQGSVHHRFSPANRKGPIIGAWARVERRDKLPVVVWLDFEGYAQTSPLWAKIPTTMIEKCARVAALRKAYPEAFGGLYIREEMPAEEFGGGTVVDVQPSPALPAETVPPGYESTAQLAARATRKPALSRGSAAKARAAAAAVGGAVLALAPAPLPVPLAFGPQKGTPIPDLADKELSGAIDTAHAKLAESPEASWANNMRANLAALEEELDRRIAEANRLAGQ